MNKYFNEFITYKTLAYKHGFSSALDMEDIEGIEGKLEIKNVCTKMSKQLADRLDNTISFLDIRKRKFVEMAIIQALDEAEEIIKDLVSSDEDWIDNQRTDKEAK